MPVSAGAFRREALTPTPGMIRESARLTQVTVTLTGSKRCGLHQSQATDPDCAVAEMQLARKTDSQLRKITGKIYEGLPTSENRPERLKGDNHTLNLSRLGGPLPSSCCRSVRSGKRRLVGCAGWQWTRRVPRNRDETRLIAADDCRRQDGLGV